MRKPAFILLLSIFLAASQIAKAQAWQADVEKAVASIQPEFKAKATEFRQVPLEELKLPEDTSTAQLGLPEAVYRKIITLPNPETRKKFKIELEVYVTKNAEQAEVLKTVTELMEAFLGKSGFTCNAPGKSKRPCYSVFYANNLIMLTTLDFKNQKALEKYGAAFDQALPKQ